MRKYIAIALCGMILISSCGVLQNNTQKGAAIGAGGGAVLGGALGALFGKDGTEVFFSDFEKYLAFL